MNFLRLLPVILSLVLLAAHFLRWGLLPLTALCLLLPLLLLLKNPWVPRLLQLVLLGGAVLWLRTLWQLAAMRQAHGQPAGRMVAILAAVAVFTAASALVFRAASLRRRYGGGRPPAGDPAA